MSGFGVCPFCSADNAGGWPLTTSANHANDCPNSTNLYPADQRSGIDECMACQRAFTAGESWSWAEVVPHEPLVACVDCSARLTLEGLR